MTREKRPAAPRRPDREAHTNTDKAQHMIAETETRGTVRCCESAKGRKIEDSARRCISENCSYAFSFRAVTFHFSNGVLTMHGRLPSFYLKQVLQTLLRDLDGVKQINNQVDVVTSTA
jgi:hypothetical protein